MFHVNGDDIEAVVQTLDIALRYRQQYSRDVFVDLLCYRKYGHNEGDEPKFTQPKLYKLIANHPNPGNIFNGNILMSRLLVKKKACKWKKNSMICFKKHVNDAKQIEKAKITNFLEDVWSDYRKSNSEDFQTSPDTSVNKETLIKLAKKLNYLPDGKKYFRKIVKLFE